MLQPLFAMQSTDLRGCPPLWTFAGPNHVSLLPDSPDQVTIALGEVVSSQVVSRRSDGAATLRVITYEKPQFQGLGGLFAMCGLASRTDMAAERVRRVHEVPCTGLGHSTAVSASIRLLRAVRGGLNADVEAGLSSESPEPATDRMIVLCNPSSGPGGGLVRFQRHCAHMLRDAGFDIEIHATSGPRDATAFLLSMPGERLSSYAAVVAVGGDGTVHEVLQGLLDRPDAPALLAAGRPRLGVIPTGSGNGLCYSFCMAAGLPFTLSDCALLISQRRHVRLDVASVFTQAGTGPDAVAPPASDLPIKGVWGKRHFSFLSQEWGLIADLDIESEALRCLGAARFDVYGAYRGLCLRKYHGRFSWLPASDDGAGALAPLAAAAGSSKEDGPGGFAAGYSQAAASPFRVTALQPFDLPASSAPGWVTAEGTFTFLWVTSTSHQSVGVSCSPTTRGDDGTFTITMVRDVSPAGMISVLLGLDGKGSVTRNPRVEVHRARAYRLEPDGSEGGVGHIVVDGELVPYAPTQAEIHPRLLPMFGAL